MDEVDLLKTGCAGWWFVQLVRPPYSQVINYKHSYSFHKLFNEMFSGMGTQYILTTSWWMGEIKKLKWYMILKATVLITVLIAHFNQNSFQMILPALKFRKYWLSLQNILLQFQINTKLLNNTAPFWDVTNLFSCTICKFLIPIIWLKGFAFRWSMFKG